ncbi:SET domain-containing protein-lysine N-methyltransferase [Chlamydia sp.]|uniref:SET domain-containing protein n=1 Tax=Chlamydia sp. TaxID=35827 RepID=UPI0025B8E9B2|nr:SET domain-containing protein-lysine N-methyltransferase [Chlamydia sp.]MBQ8498768.1 SET domain-containing protein-lysine N-methyltransferase [Chlamydia sp.]
MTTSFVKDPIYISLQGGVHSANPYPVARAEKLLQFSFLPQLAFQDPRTEKRIQQLCLREEKSFKISSLAKWLGQLHKQQLRAPKHPPTAICWINSYVGYGVFAREFIPAWSYIGEYTGILRRRQALWLDENDYCFRYPVPRYALRYFTIDSETHGNITRFINHSDNPNLEATGAFENGLFHIIIRAIKDILPGDELCYDYGPLYWKHRKKREEFIPEEE